MTENEFDSTDHWEQPGGAEAKAGPPPIEIPLNLLSDEATQALIEAFILREGTDYGANEVSLETKQRQVRSQIESGDVKIIFDPSTESVTLLTVKQWEQPR